MRILIVSGIFHPEVGGPSTYLYELANALHADGHVVGVVAYGREEPGEAYPYPVWRVSRQGNALRRLMRFLRVLWNRSRGFSLWYVNDYGLPAALLATIRRPHIVMKIVGDFAWEYSRRHGLTLDGIDEFQTRRYPGRIRLLKTLQRFYVSRAACVIVPSRYLAGIVRSWDIPSDRIAVVYNAVRVPGRSPGRREFPTPTIITAARLAPWKGIDHLLQMMALVRARVPDAQLIVAGDGPEREALTALSRQLGLEASVRWLGAIPREELLEWLRTADVFALLSDYEGFSHVLLEAMSSGTAIVASPAGGNAELVRDGVDGRLVDPRDHGRGGEVIAELLLDRGLRERFSAAAARRGAEFQWGRLLEETIAVFERVEGSR